ncbi:hypothetical protein [Arthrobacter sp. A2-55]|uniref:hypothetical protein n=1 Tax=Arthrobacter sp. A2-55 TaxID=2897337 RepID=UPI0021CD372C|nr:hypothetical protein [Arthrobacter sp. A2-55]MCU6479064.1 hypothetical protein [Arthrobacter sp. A2-55]
MEDDLPSVFLSFVAGDLLNPLDHAKRHRFTNFPDDTRISLPLVVSAAGEPPLGGFAWTGAEPLKRP